MICWCALHFCWDFWIPRKWIFHFDDDFPGKCFLFMIFASGFIFMALCCILSVLKKIDNWSVKAIRRKTTGTGRMRYLRNVPRRFKSGFREGISQIMLLLLDVDGIALFVVLHLFVLCLYWFSYLFFEQVLKLHQGRREQQQLLKPSNEWFWMSFGIPSYSFRKRFYEFGQVLYELCYCFWWML